MIPKRTIVATIGLLYVIQQLALSFYGPDARPVAAPFNFRIVLPVVRLFRLQALRRRGFRRDPARRLGWC